MRGYVDRVPTRADAKGIINMNLSFFFREMKGYHLQTSANIYFARGKKRRTQKVGKQVGMRIGGGP